ncbi:hypothetical protein BFR04_09125 [Gaetbulibacter sp. 4G1]|nr:OmpA family protein [Gaetbulibacter sp. 4G1]PIA77591.1 hypothetical protein BFR04_09125 [Gaetbulibacter sp. 4G1]
MKYHYKLLITLFFAINIQLLSSQNEANPWAIEIGANAIDVYPVGESTPHGNYFDEFFNLNDHWNFGTYVAITRSLTDRISLTAKGSVNEISKWGDLGKVDESILVDNLKYYGLDAMVNFKILKDTKLKPFISIGGGYTWIEEGLYNTFSNRNGIKNLVGAGTVNGAIGVKYDITNQFGLNFQTTYKHAFKDYLTKHWQHSLGVSFNLGKQEKEQISENADLDTDGDGIIDAYDLCPKTYGSKTFAGCPDTDNDGVPDSIDKCPNVKGGDRGCPQKETQIVQNTAQPSKVITNTSKVVYFNSNSSTLGAEAKSILNEIVKISKGGGQYKIQINAHTDSDGSNQFNNKLSIDRANNVKQYLLSKQLSSNNISVNNYGETQPVSDNNTNLGKALNRRAKVIIKVVSN